jgi:hypothetical protein
MYKLIFNLHDILRKQFIHQLHGLRKNEDNHVINTNIIFFFAQGKNMENNVRLSVCLRKKGGKIRVLVIFKPDVGKKP